MQLPKAYLKIEELKTSRGKIILYTNPTRSLVYAEASGYISPDLLKQDLAFVSGLIKVKHKPGPTW